MQNRRAELEATQIKLRAIVQQKLALETNLLAEAIATLKAVSPEATLQRGYAILRTPDQKIVRTTADIKKGDLLEGVLSEGTFVAQVVGTNSEGKLLNDIRTGS